MFPPSRRLGNALGFVACAAMMTYAFYAQYGLGLEPCPLCMFQRVGIVALGVGFLFAGFTAVVLLTPTDVVFGMVTRVQLLHYALVIGLPLLVIGAPRVNS
ncbi:MAG: disulfide bond formation protein B [Gammaproteobacteria bacterium]|nr:disulfide bond formation protein B [Gammaproteobacteria bacterium]